MAWTIDLLTPLDNAVDVPVLPTFTWDKVDGGGVGAPLIRINFAEVGGAYVETDGFTYNPIRVDSPTSVDIYDETGAATGGTLVIRGNDAFGEQPDLTGVGTFLMENVAHHAAQSWYSSEMGVDITGLDPAKTYNVYIYGNRGSGTVDFDFYANADTANKVHYVPVVAPVNAITDLPALMGVAPDGTGKLEINTMLNGGYAILCGMFIEEVAGGGVEPSTVIHISKLDPSLQNSINIGAGIVAAGAGIASYTVALANQLTDDTIYYWGVSLDGGVTFDEIRKFTTVSLNPLTAPGNLSHGGSPTGDTGVIFRPTFTWVKTDAAVLFDFQISVNSDFSGVVGAETWTIQTTDNIAAETFTPIADLARDTLFYWRVRSTDNTEYDSAWSTTQMSFTTKYGTPDAAILVSPTLAQTGVSLTHTFTWTDGGGGETYDFYLSTDETFPTGALASGLVPTQYTAVGGNMQNAAPYYWKVVTHGDGQTVDSGVSNFTSAAPNVPFAPGLVSPINTATKIYVRPTFIWNASVGATKYKIEIADNVGFTNAIIYNDYATLSLTITEFLVPGTIYYWRVTAGNLNGYGSASDYKIFTTQVVQSVDIPILLAPTDRAGNQPLSPSLVWDWTAQAALVGTNYGALPATPTRSIQSVVVDFTSAPTSVVANKAPLKYNKEGVVTAAIDDGMKTVYSAFPSVQSNVYTDGCGNDIPFAYAIAHYPIAGNGKEVHEHPDYASLAITWAEIIEMLKGGCSLANHGFIDNNAVGLLKLADAYTKWKTSGRALFPSGIPRGFDQKVYVGVSGMDVAAQSLANGGYGCEAVNYGSSALTGPANGTDLNIPIASSSYFANIFRRFESGYADANTMISTQAVTEKRWMNFGFHSGSALASLMSTVGAAHGKAGTDKAWVPSLQELIEYIWVRENTAVSVIINGTQATIILDTTNIPEDLMWYALSLNIEADANISAITINGGITTGVRKNSHNINYQSALVNLQWNGHAYPTREFMADAETDIAEITNNAESRDVALAFTNLVPTGIEKTALESRITALGANTYVSSEAPGIIEEGVAESFDPEGLAMKYAIQLAPASTPEAPVLDVVDLENKTYVYPGILTKHTEYVWKVKASNEISSSKWSEVFSFNTLFGPPLLPSLDSPTDTAGGVALDSLLEWSGGGEVDSWDIQVSTDPTFATNLIIDVIGELNLTYGLTGSLELNTQYYWRVRGVNTYGTGAWAQAEFTTALPSPPPSPSYLTPASGSVDVSRTPTIHWNTAFSADFYAIELRVDNPGGADDNLVVLSQEVHDVTYVIVSTALGYGTNYKWRVRAENAGGVGVWGAYWYFTTLSEPLPTKVSLLSPYDGATSQTSPIAFTWAAVQYALEYKLEISTTDGVGFDAAIIATYAGVQALNYTSPIELNYSQQYYWRVTASNESGLGTPSDIWGFLSIGVPLPNAIILTSPEDNATGIGEFVNCVWQADPRADTYIVELAAPGHTLGEFGNEMGAETSNTSALLAGIGGLAYDTLYSWRVKGKNTSGEGAYSQTRSFTTGSLPVPVPPTNLAVTPEGSVLPTITFEHTQIVDHFSIKVIRDTDGVEVFSIANTHALTIEVSTQLYYETSHTVNVYAANVSGNSAPATLTFVTGAPTLPQPPTPVTPVNGSTGVSELPMLTFEALNSVGAVLVGHSVNFNYFDSGSNTGTIPVLDDEFLQWVDPLPYNSIFKWSCYSVYSFNDGTLTKNTGKSADFTFTIQAPPTPNTPTVTPSGGNITRLPLIEWDNGSITDTYDLQVATDAGFTSLIVDETDLVSLSYSGLSTLAYSTQYFIRVRGKNIYGTGAWGESNFTTIALVAPTKVIITAPTPDSVDLPLEGNTVVWDVVAGADEYEYQIAVGTNDFTSVPSEFTANSSLSLDALDWYTNYYIRVRGKNEVHTGEWSDVLTIRTVKPELSLAVLLSPADASYDVALGTSALSFRWNTIKNHGSDQYNIEVSADPGFNNIVFSGSGAITGDLGVTNENSLDVASTIFAFSATYYWRVNVWNQWESKTTGIFTFSTESTPTPDAPILLLPTDTAVNLPPAVAFSWGVVPYGDDYLLEIFTDEAMTTQVYGVELGYDPNDVNSIPNNHTLDLGVLDFITKYYWRVTATSDLYGTSAISELHEFTISDVLIPGKPLITFPYFGAAVYKYDKIEWEDTVNTDYYIMEIALDEYFKNIILRKDTLVKSDFTMLSDYVDRDYFVRVKSVNDLTDSFWSNHVKFGGESTRDEGDADAGTVDPVTIPSITAPVDGRDLEEFSSKVGALAKRTLYGLCDLDVYEEALELLFDYEHTSVCTGAVAGFSTYSISVDNGGEGSYYFKHGYNRKPNNLVEFRVTAPFGSIIQSVTLLSSEGSTLLSYVKTGFNFIMPAEDVVIAIAYEQGFDYALTWTDRLCNSAPGTFDLKWSSRVCLSNRAAFSLEWAGRVCNSNPSEYGLEWSQRICNSAPIDILLEWSDRVCVSSTADARLELHWTDRVCNKAPAEFELEWSARVCNSNPIRYELEWSSRVCTKLAIEFELEWSSRVCLTPAPAELGVSKL